MELKEVNAENFEDSVTKTDNVVLIDFYASWCGPCRMLSPIIEELNDEIGDSVDMYKVNIDDNLEIAKQQNVLSVPTLILFKNGEEVSRLVGLRQKSQIKEAISKVQK